MKFYIEETLCHCLDVHTLYVEDDDLPELGALLEYTCPKDEKIHVRQVMGMDESENLEKDWLLAVYAGKLR